MTKRRRKKIGKIMFDQTYKYVSKGKFDYLFRQGKLYSKNEAYLRKMSRKDFKRLTQRLLATYRRK